ncbi:MAG: 16S rRNA processing protein RimM [Bacteroidales bacterium]|nr:16S rRNA processing protein RimM [Bacteroidales bacterium]
MKKEDFYYLGKIVKTSGYKGNLVFFFDVDDISHYQDLEAVFIDIAGNLIPFAIRSIAFTKGAQAFVSLMDIHSQDEAEALAGCSLYLPVSYLPELSGKNFYFHEIIGFEVMDETLGALGPVSGVMDQTSQPVLIIVRDRKEILVPASDEIIMKIDRKARKIFVKTPEGLVDLYL